MSFTWSVYPVMKVKIKFEKIWFAICGPLSDIIDYQTKAVLTPFWTLCLMSSSSFNLSVLCINLSQKICLPNFIILNHKLYDIFQTNHWCVSIESSGIGLRYRYSSAMRVSCWTLNRLNSYHKLSTMVLVVDFQK